MWSLQLLSAPPTQALPSGLNEPQLSVFGKRNRISAVWCCGWTFTARGREYKKAGGTQIYLEMFIKLSYLGVKVQLRVDLKVFLIPLYKV